MSRWRRTAVALAILGAVMLLTLGYAVIKPAHADRIAFANSMTGPTCSEGTESLAAVNLYIDEVSRAGVRDPRPP